MKRNLRILIWLGLIAIIARGVDWGRLTTAFGRLDWLPWAGAVGLFVLAQVVSSVRWQMFARPLGFAGSTVVYVTYYFVGMFFNLALPTSIGGDVARAWYLARGARSTKRPETLPSPLGGEGLGVRGCSYASSPPHPNPSPPRGEGLSEQPLVPRRFEAFLTVFAERLSGLFMLALLTCVAALVSPISLSPRVVSSVGIVAAGMIAGLVLLWLIPVGMPTGTGLRARLAAVAGVYRRRPRLLLTTALLSFVVQALNVGVVAAVGAALHLSVGLEYYAVIVPLVTLLTLLPISINGVGVRELGYFFFLQPLGVTEEMAVLMGVLSFAATALPALAGGLVVLFDRRQPHGTMSGKAPAAAAKQSEAHPSDAA